jgi:hypothetical protein
MRCAFAIVLIAKREAAILTALLTEVLHTHQPNLSVKGRASKHRG